LPVASSSAHQEKGQMSEAADGSVVTEEQTLDFLRNVAQTALELPPDLVAHIGRETSLLDGFQLDSLKQVVLMARIEDSFGFEFSPDDLDRVQQFETVGDLIALVRDRATTAPLVR
jgi:acyl carrier protein